MWQFLSFQNVCSINASKKYHQQTVFSIEDQLNLNKLEGKKIQALSILSQPHYNVL